MKQILIVSALFLLFLSFTTCSDKKEQQDDTKIHDTREQVTEPVKEEDSREEDMQKVNSKDTLTTTEDEETRLTEKTTETTSSMPTERTRQELGPDGEGILSFREGDVDLVRNGSPLGDKLYEGFEIQNYDLVSTGEESYAEIEVYSSRCPDTLITVMENTTFSFEINKLESSKNTTFDVFAGTIALKVNKLAGDQQLEVLTGEASMGVRGTAFTVAALPTGDALVTCTSGKVECTDDATGMSFVVQPGKVMEKAGGGGMRRLDVPAGDEDEYMETWYEKKVQLLKSDALAEIRKYVKDYESRIEQFTKAFNDLMNEDAIIDKWIAEDKKGKIGSTMDIMKEKKKIIGHIYEIQKILFWFKHVYYRLAELKKFHDQGFGRGEIRTGYTTTDFFNSFTRAEVDSRLADLRYIYKLYAKRNDGSVPVGSVSDDDFFGDDNF
ncbi:MAG: FecR domain-containing protein [Spirochaetales bacterium]|nr:FecR domain-containing protein [Spirochaetales bacterium]